MTSNITQTNNLRLHPLFYNSSQKDVQGEFIKRGENFLLKGQSKGAVHIRHIEYMA
jgi:hypothetical protein